MPSGVYLISNTKTGMMYVGSAVDIQARWDQHRGQLRRGRHSIRQLQRDWNVLGPAAFAFTVLETVETVERLSTVEQKWLDAYRRTKGLQSLYNLQLAIPARRASHSEGAPSGGRFSRHLTFRRSQSLIEGCVLGFVYLVFFTVVTAIPLMLFLAPVLVIKSMLEFIGLREDIAIALGFLGGTVPGLLLVYTGYRLWLYVRNAANSVAPK